jgi:hypothetical protein
MDKLTTAEWLLARITSRPRAEEILGDLIERRLSAFAFCLAFTRIVLAFTWRWLVGIPAAMVSIAIIGVPYVEILKPQVELAISHGQNLDGHRLIQASVYVLLAAIALVSVAFLALARYGWRSSITRMAAAMTIPLALCAFALCAHRLFIGFGMLALALLVLTVSAARNPRGAATVTTTAVSLTALLFSWSYLLTLSIQWFGAASAVVLWFTVAAWPAIYIGEAVILSQTQRWLRVEG